jgi:monoamine oxidase
MIVFKRWDFFMQKKKVLVLGGGFAGLTAAHDLIESGQAEVMVLEARDRLGGRAVSHKMKNGDLVQLGANWLHGYSEKHALYNFTIGNNPLLSSVPYVGSEDYFSSSEESEQEGEVEQLMSLINLQGAKPELGILEEEFFTTSNAAKVYTFEERPEVDNFITQDFSTIIDHISKNIPTTLNARVFKVEQKNGKVSTSYSKDGQELKIETDYIINTLPVGALKAKTIEYLPPLSVAKENALTNLNMTKVIKVMLSFDKDAFKAANLKHMDLGFKSEDDKLNLFGGININALDESSSTLLLYLSDYHRVEKYLSNMSFNEIADLALETISMYFPTLNKETLTDVYGYDWTKDEYSHGAYPYITKYASGDDLESFLMREGNMFFAGDAHGIMSRETRDGVEYINYRDGLDGAVTSGHNVAHELLAEIAPCAWNM